MRRVSALNTVHRCMEQSTIVAAARETEASVRARHWTWLAAGVVLSFLVPFVLADQVGLPSDVYYGIYAVFVVALFLAWAHDTGQSVREMVSRRWRLAVALGIAFAAISALIAVRAEDGGSHPGGLEFAAALVWRGVVYGAADGLLLSAFPILVVFAALAHTRLRGRRFGVVAVGAIALAASLVMTATYHAGYEDFRSEKIRKPLSGDIVWSVPTLVTVNPIGAPMAHAGLHVSAVAHNYESDLLLPPHGD
jgi:hypothetical protein